MLQVSSIEQTAFHFSLDSNLLHKESDEAQRQLARQEGTADSSAEEESDGEQSQDGLDTPDKNLAEQLTGKKTSGGEKRLRNQFNFSERASQTLNNPYRVRSRLSCAW